MKTFLYFVPLLMVSMVSCILKDDESGITPDLQDQQNSKTYLALGDSYTIGESVLQKESFPFQLSSLLKSQGLVSVQPKIIARTGWTTNDLAGAIQAENIKDKFDVVTLLIGVNNQYRGYSKDIYREEFIELLNTAINFANGKKERVFVISIPDWGATPFAEGQDRKKISREIDEFNSICQAETLKAGIDYTDITPGSREALTDKGLIAADGLHPSARMYATWADALAPKIASILKKN